MLMKKVAVTFAALAAAVSAHAQLSSETTTGSVLVSSGSTYDVSFSLPADSFGGGALGFTLIDAADVTFSGGTSTPFSFGTLSGTSLSSPLAFYFTSGSGTKTVDLSAGTYTYTALGAALFSPANLYVDVNAVSAVPEPQTYGMLLAGLAVIGVSVRRRRMPVVSRSVAMSC